MESLGQKLARFREEAGLKQTALAKLIESTAPTLSKIENNVRAPTVAALSKILLVFKSYLKWNDDEYRTIYDECFRQLGNLSSSISLIQEIPLMEASKTPGILAIHKNTDFDYLHLKWLDAKKEIRIITTGFLDSEPTYQELIDASKRDLSIQVLILEPESETVRQRLLDVKYRVSSYAPMGCLENLQGIVANQQSKRMEVRMYKSLPPYSAFIIDDWCLLGFFWHGISASHGPRIELDLKASILGEFISKNYSAIWNDARPIPLKGL